MDSDPSIETTVPLSGHVTWFAPWRWFATQSAWRRWAVIIAVLLASYVESPVAMVPLLEQWQLPYSDEFIELVYAPLIVAIEIWPDFEEFYTYQMDGVMTLLDWLKS